MCGRFYLDADAEFLLNYFKIKYKPAVDIPKDTVFPAQSAPVVIEHKSERRFGQMNWGFRRPEDKRVIFNSRSEGIFDKWLFKEAIRSKRCVVPATGFYEWNAEKTGYSVELPDHALMCFAGIYRKQLDKNGEEEWAFSIVTREANADMHQIHERMPLMLKPEEVDLWLSEAADVSEITSVLNADIGALLLSLKDQPSDLGQIKLDI